MSSETQTLEQKRAADALRKIQELAPEGQKYYVSYVSALPATIVMNGLGQALAMLLAKAGGHKRDDHYRLYQHLTDWLGHQIPELAATNDDGVLLKLVEQDQGVYVRAQAEAMTYLHWLRQFARAYLRESGPAND